MHSLLRAFVSSLIGMSYVANFMALKSLLQVTISEELSPLIQNSSNTLPIVSVSVASLHKHFQSSSFFLTVLFVCLFSMIP